MSKLTSLISLCIISKCVISGEVLFKSFKSKKIYLILIADNVGPNNRKKLLDKCAFYQIDYLIVDNFDEVVKELSLNNRKFIGITNKGLADKIKSI
ncbi:MAG: 50S ribosomal protein L7ae [Erysipelotrichaceae bacterium]